MEDVVGGMTPNTLYGLRFLDVMSVLLMSSKKAPDSGRNIAKSAERREDIVQKGLLPL